MTLGLWMVAFVFQARVGACFPSALSDCPVPSVLRGAPVAKLVRPFSLRRWEATPIHSTVSAVRSSVVALRTWSSLGTERKSPASPVSYSVSPPIHSHPDVRLAPLLLSISLLFLYHLQHPTYLSSLFLFFPFYRRSSWYRRQSHCTHTPQLTLCWNRKYLPNSSSSTLDAASQHLIITFLFSKSSKMFPQTPTIEIHLAQDFEDSETTFEIKPIRSSLYSPKCPSPMAYTDSDADDFRPVHLLPPPVASPVAPRPTLPADKKGIDQDRFQQLLKATRERPAGKFGHARSNSAELRRVATLKAHTTKARKSRFKQPFLYDTVISDAPARLHRLVYHGSVALALVERRALFMSKVAQPPTSVAIESPATPPESPAVFHFTLPSPGLQSPIAAYEKLAKEAKRKPVAFPATQAEIKTVPGWVEEVDFKARARTTSIRKGRAMPGLAPPVPHTRHGRRASANGLPSLDQITARLAKSSAAQPINDLEPATIPQAKAPRAPLRLNLHRRSPSSPLVTSPVTSQVVTVKASVEPSVTSRLPAFLQKRKEAQPQILVPQPKTPTILVSAPVVPVKTPRVEAPTQRSVPVVRTRRQDPEVAPITPIRPSSHPGVIARPPTRSSSYPHNQRPVTPETRKQTGLEMLEKLRRRSSAPASLPALAKDNHPVLSMKGGF